MTWTRFWAVLPLCLTTCGEPAPDGGGTEGGGGSCPDLVTDCALICGPGNVEVCSCVDGYEQIECKDGSSTTGQESGGDGGSADGDGGSADGDGGSADGDGGSADGDGGSADGGSADGGSADDGGTTTGAGDDGTTSGSGDDTSAGSSASASTSSGDTSASGSASASATSGDTGGVVECGDLNPPAANAWSVVIDFVPTGGFAYLRVTWDSGDWSARYTHKVYRGAPIVDPPGDPPFVVDWNDDVMTGNDPVEARVTYDDGVTVFEFVAQGGTTTVYEVTGQGNHSEGTMVGMQYEEWTPGNGLLVPGGCAVSLPDLGWDGTAI